MSEKKEAGLSEIDIQAVIAAWIIANDGCGGSSNGVDCYGERGIFKGTVCQFYRRTGCIAYGDAKVGKAKAWLEKYHQQKAESAEAEKRKAETAKKEEQQAKQEPARICGNCKYIHEVEKSENMTAQCDMKNSMVPILFDRCPDFEPMAAADQSGPSFSEGGADAAAYAELAVELCRSGECDAKKDRADLAAKCEHLTGQRNRLSKCLIVATRRVKELEQENAELRSKHKHPWSVFLCADGVDAGKITFL